MDKLKMQTADGTMQNIERIAQLFPNCVTEVMKDGKETLAIDFDRLRQELSDHVVEGNDERYQFTWPDKRKAQLAANAPISATLRPCREESVDFDTTGNLYIEGDNLDVLKCLKETYSGKIDVIYIDPPYNTGRNLIYMNDFVESTNDYIQRSGQYDDLGNRLVANTESNGRFHTDWLNMIYPRLRVAKDLLSENGIIVLTIDDCEIETITMLMNEIFGDSNHLGTIIIKNNPSGRSTVSGVSISHEYALFYSKNSTAKLGRLPRNDKQISRYKEEDENGKFEWVNFRKHGGYKEDAPTMYFPIYIKNDGSSFRVPKLKWNFSLNEYDILEDPTSDEFVSYPDDENGRPRRWKWSLERTMNELSEMVIRYDKNKVPAVYVKARMKDEGMLPLTVWDDKLYSSTEYGTNLLNEIFGDKYFDYPKSLYAVIDSIKTANVNRNSIVLDFFSGSATTAHAVMQLNAEDGGNRKFIMVQLPEQTDAKSEAYKAGYQNICEIGKERIRRAGNKIKAENPNANALDTGFRVLKLADSNMLDVYYSPAEVVQQDLFAQADNIKSDRTPEDLLFQVMLELGVLLDSKIEVQQVAGKQIYNVADGFLIACFDKGVTDEVITAIAKQHPQYAVLRDSSYADDSTATNFEQLFKTYSPSTTIKTL